MARSNDKTSRRERRQAKDQVRAEHRAAQARRCSARNPDKTKCQNPRARWGSRCWRHVWGWTWKGLLAIGAAVFFWVGNVANVLSLKAYFFPPVSETELSPLALNRIEDRMKRFGKMRHYEIASDKDFEEPLAFLKAFTDTPGHYTLTPGGTFSVVITYRGTKSVMERAGVLTLIEDLKDRRARAMSPMSMDIYPGSIGELRTADGGVGAYFMNPMIDEGPNARAIPGDPPPTDAPPRSQAR